MEFQDNNRNETDQTEEVVVEKINIWQQIGYALSKAGTYLDMIKFRTGKSIKYVLILMLLVAIMTYAIPTAAAISTFGGFKNLFLNKLPALRMEKGGLTSEKSFDIDISGTHFYVDTEQDMIPNDDLEDDSVYIAIGKKAARCLIVKSGMVVEYYRFDLDEILPDGFNNQSLANLTPYIYISLCFSFLMVIIQNLVKYSVLALIYMILAVPLSRGSGLGLSKFQVFMLCFYAQTFGILLVNINAALGYLLPAFLLSIIGVFVTYQRISAVFFPYFRDKFED